MKILRADTFLSVCKRKRGLVCLVWYVFECLCTTERKDVLQRRIYEPAEPKKGTSSGESGRPDSGFTIWFVIGNPVSCQPEEFPPLTSFCVGK